MLSKKKKIITGVVVLAAILILGFWYFFQKDRITVPDTYKYDDLTEYVTLGNYKGIRYTKKVKKVSDSDVQSEVKKAIKKASTTKDVKNGTVGSDSKVKIDFTGKINGKKFDGGSAEDYTLDIANDSMIDGFSEGIVGHKVGDKFDLKLKFPKDYSNKDVAGKNVVFTVKVKAIVKTNTPEYNDAFVEKNTKYKNMAEYEKSIRTKLEKENEATAEKDAYSEVFAKILKDSEVKKYPEKELDASKESMKETYKNLAKQYNLEYEDFLKQYMKMDEKSFNKQVDAYAKNSVKQQLVMRQLAKELDVTVTDEEYNEYLQELLKQNGMTEDSFEEQSGTSLKEYAQQNNMYEGLLYEKIMKQVMKLSKAE